MNPPNNVSSAADLTGIFGSAAQTGAVSNATLQQIGVVDLGEQIQAGFGISVDDVQATEVVLVGVLIDDSGSIRFAGNTENVRSGHNLVIDSLSGSGSKTRDGILMMTRYLNGKVLFPFVSIDQATKMDSRNYNPDGGTPLFDQTVVFLATMLAKAQEFLDAGVPCRTISLIVTDGADIHSVKQNAASAAKLVGDMYRAENHIIAAMGIEDPSAGGVDFKDIFKQMGIDDRWILTPANSQKEIRDAFHTFSQSAVRASQNAAAFSQAAGGFGN